MLGRTKNVCEYKCIHQSFLNLLMAYMFPVLYIWKYFTRKIRQLWILYFRNLLCYKFQSILIQKEPNFSARYPSNRKRQHADRHYQPTLFRLKADMLYNLLYKLLVMATNRNCNFHKSNIVPTTNFNTNYDITNIIFQFRITLWHKLKIFFFT